MSFVRFGLRDFEKVLRLVSELHGELHKHLDREDPLLLKSREWLREARELHNEWEAELEE